MLVGKYPIKLNNRYLFVMFDKSFYANFAIVFE